MSYELILRPAAQLDITQAHDWYEARRPGLGAEFRHELEEMIARILETPTIYPVVRRSIRRARTHRFPYAIYFVHEPTRIQVLACLHGRRDPRWVRLRLR